MEVYTLVIDGTQQGTPYSNVDDVMTDTFLIWEGADFSDWKSQEGINHSWMDIIVSGNVVGQIQEMA